MQVFSVRHLTRYRYARPVRFGEHRMMLRPREDPDQRLLGERLTITPEPDALSFSQDRLGNWIATARFDREASELSFESELTVERAASRAGLRPAPPIADDASPADGVDAWARRFLAGPSALAGIETLAAMSDAIHRGFTYRRRLEHGIQTPAETLELGSGACRDFAMLMVEAARRLGLQARFASGYVHAPVSRAEARRRIGGHTHAWAYVRTPEQGWVDVDPTAGQVGPVGLIRIAAADDPGDAAPIQGVYFGEAGHFLGMDVHVEVRTHAPRQRRARPREPSGLRSVA